MNLFEAYNTAVKARDIVDDATQRHILGTLERVMNELEVSVPWYKPWLKKSIKGAYIWGPVGGGKTYLMDLFYQNVEEKQKARFHFHYFMQQVDKQLRLLQGHSNPLREIASNLAKTTKILCLDEFLVSDVAHAMILAELLTAIIEHHVVLVVTANTAPDDLYLNGVRREQFLPAIALIKSHCDIVGLIEHRDYRVGRGALPQAYLYPLGKKSADALSEQFKTLSVHETQGGQIKIQERPIEVVKSSDHAVWFEFDVICNLPRSQLDYLEIADLYDTVFVSNIPKLRADDTAKVILFMHFIDVIYDRGIRLIVSAAVSAKELYTEGAMLGPFKRTLSRLEELQSADYLNRHAHTVVQSSLVG